MNNKHQFKLGLFVCFSIFLFIGLLIFLGIMDQFKDKAIVTTYLPESVQGLTKGSGVKLMGVPIGHVKDITFEAETRLIRIDMEIDLSKIRISDSSTGSAGNVKVAKNDFYELARRSIEEDKLRAKLESEGITGVKFIQFNYMPNDKTPLLFKPGWNTEENIFYIPGVPSLLQNLETSVTGILNKLNEIDYKDISKRLISTLDATDKLVRDPKLASIISNVDSASAELAVTAKTINENVTKEQIQELIAKSHRLLESYQQLAAVLEQEVKSAELKETSIKARGSLETFRRSNLQFVDSMNKINDGIDALIELIQMLESNPSAVIYGKRNLDDLGVRRQ